jgi:methylglutaconyl-CoA hydratase
MPFTALNTFQEQHTMSNYTVITYEVTDAAAFITLNRPDKRNALNEALVSELKQALTVAEHDGAVKAVVLRGAGKDFCAGADLAQLQKVAQATLLENVDDALGFAELLLQMRRCPKPILAAVHGRALAGGAGIASACDLVMATRSAQFCYTEVKIGFVPAMVMAIARRNLSEKRAFELLTTAKLLSATEAAAFGFINRVCEDAEFETALAQFVGELTAVSASAVRLTKYLLYQTDAMTFEQALRTGVDVNAMARLTPDCQQGVQRFLQRG